jgi:hypothetical protein
MSRLFLFPVIVAGAFLGDRVARAQDVQQCIASNERSIELRRANRLRDALDEMRTCAAESCPAEVRAVCQQRIAEIHAAIPSIVFSARDGSGHDLVAVKVSVDGKPLADKLDGTAIAIDPGQHEFTFEVEGEPALKQRLIVREGEKDRHETVVIGSLPVTPSAEGEQGGGRRTVGLVVGGAGLASALAGGVLGLVASSKWNASKSECGVSSCSDHAAAVTDHDSAVELATGSTISIVVGGVAIAAGAALFLMAPAGHGESTKRVVVRLAPALGPQGAGVLLQGDLR